MHHSRDSLPPRRSGAASHTAPRLRAGLALASFAALAALAALAACDSDTDSRTATTTGTTGIGGSGAGGQGGTGAQGGAGGEGVGGQGGAGGQAGGGGEGGAPCEPATEQCDTPDVDESCDGVPECTGAHVLSIAFAGMSSQAVRRVATTPEGNALVLGDFTGTIDLGGGPLTSATPADADIFVARFDSQGNHLWSKRFGGTGDDLQDDSSIVVDAAGDVLLMGSLTDPIDFGGGEIMSVGGYDVFLVKLDGQGNHLWSKRFGGVGWDWVGSMGVDAAGNVLAAGRFGANINFGGSLLSTAGGYDIFLTKLDPDGNHIWSQRFGDVTDDRATGVAADADGNVLLGAVFDGAINLGGGALTSAGSFDIAVAKFDPDGAHLWSKALGTTSAEDGGAVAVAPNGNVLLAGSTGGGLYVAALDPVTGTVVWDKSGSGNGGLVFPRLAVDGLSNMVVAGSFVGTTIDFGGEPLMSAGSYDVFALKLDPAGEFIWGQRFGDPGDQQALGLGLDVTGSAWIGGFFEGTLELGAPPLVCTEPTDGFLARLAP